MRLSALKKASKQNIDPARLSGDLAQFILEFEKRFALVTPEEQKLLIRQVISKIVVEREK